MINEIVAAYLRENKRLVIPALGAFIRKDGSGEVVFVEFLKKDDGVLTELLERHYGLSRNEAVEAIAQYVEQAKQHIARHGFFIIGGVGTLRPDANSLLELSYDPSVDEKTVAVSMEAEKPVEKSVEKLVEKPAEKSVEKPIEKKNPVEVKITVAKPAPVQEKSVRPNASERVYGPENRRPSGPIETETKRVKGEERKMPEGASAVEARRPSEKTVGGEPRKAAAERPMNRPRVAPNRKKRADLIMIIAILAALMAIGVMVYSMFAQTNPVENLLEEVEVPVLQDSVSVEK